MFETVKHDPSAGELRIFAFGWLLFFLVLAAFALYLKPLLHTALGSTWALYSLFFLGKWPSSGKEKLIGLFLPGLLLIIYAPIAILPAPTGAQFSAAMCGGLALLGPLLWRARFGLPLYRLWTRGSEGVSWAFARILLAAVFFLVVTPLGLLLRCFGWDGMGLRAQASYWIPYRRNAERSRYFQTF